MEQTRELLSLWDLAEYIPVFEKNKITSSKLMEMDDQDMLALIPDCRGDFMTLKKERNQWKMTQENANPVVCASSSTPIDTWDPLLSINLSGTSDTSTYAANKSDMSQLSQPSSSATTSTWEASQFIQTSMLEGGGNSNTEKERGYSTTENRVLIGINNQYVFNLFRQSNCGAMLLQKGELKANDRPTVSKMIIRSLLSQCPSRTITTLEFTMMAKEICQLFKDECVDLWYRPYAPASKFIPKQIASGLLYESYRSKRNQYRKEGEILMKPRRKSATPSTPPQPSSSLQKDQFAKIDHPVIEGFLQWLQTTDSQDWETVKARWQHTAQYRFKAIQEGKPKYSSVEEYFQTFPILQDPLRGPELIVSDFESLYPGKEDAMYSTLLQLREKILEVARAKLEDATDKKLKVALLDLLNVPSDASFDTLNSQALLLLPFISKVPATRSIGRRNSWKPSRVEVSEGFVDQVNSSANIELARDKRRDKMIKLSRPTLPYVLFVGESFTQVEQVFSVTENILYPMKNITAAVDFCFKFFFVTHLQYPEESAHIWLTIQKGFYNIHCPEYDKMSTPCRSLMSDLGLQELLSSNSC